MILGFLSAAVDSDLDTANRMWNKATKVARMEGDTELLERIEIARSVFSAPRGLFNLLGGMPFSTGCSDLDDFYLDDFFDEDDDDDF